MTSKELSQDSKADKSQQLKKETKDQQKDAQRQRGNLLCLRRLSSVSFSGFAKAKTEQFQSNSGSESKKKRSEAACTLTTAQRMILKKDQLQRSNE